MANIKYKNMKILTLPIPVQNGNTSWISTLCICFVSSYSSWVTYKKHGLSTELPDMVCRKSKTQPRSLSVMCAEYTDESAIMC